MKNELFLWKFSGEEAADLHNPPSACRRCQRRQAQRAGRAAGGLRGGDAGSSAAQGGSESTWTDHKETLHAANPPPPPSTLPSPPYLHSQTLTHTCITTSTHSHTHTMGTNRETSVLCSQHLNSGQFQKKWMTQTRCWCQFTLI